MKPKLQFVLATVAVLSVAGAVLSPAFATLTVRRATSTLTWVINDKTSQHLVVAFYAKARGNAWPAQGRNWSLNTGRNSFRLECQTGEQVCYGAWNNQNPKGAYWGVGMGAKFGCKGCCTDCAEKTVADTLGD